MKDIHTLWTDLKKWVGGYDSVRWRWLFYLIIPFPRRGGYDSVRCTWSSYFPTGEV